MRPFSTLAAIIFAIVCIVHILRVVTGSAVNIGLYRIPMSFSYVGILVAGYLSYGLWKEANRRRR